MSFIDTVKERAKASMKTIVLPEASDIRVIEAARKVTDEGFAKVVLIGNPDEIRNVAGDMNVSDITIVDPNAFDRFEEYANAFYELRKAKGMTIEQARETLKHNIYFGTMMVKMGDADGLVAGSVCSTSDTLRPALQILKTAPGVGLVSAFFLMVVPNCEFGENGVFIYSDAGLNENPNAEQLSEIAVTSGRTFKQLVGKEPNIAMLHMVVLIVN